MAHHGIAVVASGFLLILACISCSPAEDTSETVEPQSGDGIRGASIRRSHSRDPSRRIGVGSFHVV